MLLINPSFFKSLTFCTSCNGDFELSKIQNSTASSYMYAFIYVGYTETHTDTLIYGHTCTHILLQIYIFEINDR